MVSRQRLSQLRYPEKQAARNATADAIKRGELVRPPACEQCEAPCKPDAHHDDYSKPLEVRWLCRQCHVSIHAADSPKTGKSTETPHIVLQFPDSDREKLDDLARWWGDAPISSVLRKLIREAHLRAKEIHHDRS